MVFDWKVQFLPADKPLLKEALEHSVRKEVDGVPVQVFTVEHLAAIAFELGRAKDKVRLFRFLESKDFKESRYSEILARHNLLDRWIRFKKQTIG